MKRLFSLPALLVTLSVGLVAQNVPAAPGWMDGWINTWADLLGGPWHSSIAFVECHGGQEYQVTYRIYDSGPLAGSQIPIQATATGKPCDCSKSSGGGGESNCTSGDGRGSQVTVPGMEATGSMSDWGGPYTYGPTTGPVPQSFGPPRPLGPQPLSTAAVSLASARAVPTGSTFTFTLPFRDLPSGPLITEVPAPVPWACNSSVNPTMFRVFHIDNVVKRSNLCSGEPIATIPVPDLPLQIRVTPDGSQAIVTSYSGAVTFINTGTNTVSSSIHPNDPNFAPSGIAISPDGSYALVANYLAPPYSYLAVIDVAGMRIRGKIPLDAEYPESVFINPDATLAWVTYPWDNTVEVVDILTGTLIQQLGVFEPFSIVFNPTGTRAFVSSGTGSVAVIDTTTYQVIQRVPADMGAMDLQITPDGAFIYVNNSLAHSITVIDTQSLKSTTTNINGTPQGSALVPSQ